MATQLASGFINLSVKYADGMRQIEQDLLGLQRTASQAGTRAGNALSEAMGRTSRVDQSDARRSFGTFEAAARRSGTQAGQELGEGIIAGARREVQQNGDDITEGMGLGGAKSAGGEAGAGFLAGIGPVVAQLGTKAGPIGIALAAAVGIAATMGGLLAKELMSGFDRDMANRKLQVQLGIDESQLASVNEAINNAYKNNFGESIDQLREDAAAIIKNGLVDASDTAGLQAMLEKFATVGQVTGNSVEEIASAVSRLVKSGVAEDTASALDLITVATQKGLDTSGELLDTLTEYSVQFKKIGIDGQQALGMIKQLMDGGARNVDLAADAIKEFAIRSVDGSQSTIEAYQAIGLNADQMMQTLAKGGPEATKAMDTIVDKINSITDPVKREAVGVALFGTQWEDLATAMANLNPSSARDAIGQVTGAVQEASDTLGGGALSGFESLGRTFEVLRGKFQDFLAKAFGPMAQQISAWITNALPKLGEFFQQNIGPAIQSVIPTLRDLWNGLKQGLSLIGGQYGENIKKIWPEVQKLGEAAKNAFTAALPVLKGVATAFGALILVSLKIQGVVLPLLIKGFTLLYKAIAFVYETVVPAVTGAFKTIGEIAMWLWNNAIQPAWHGIQSAISTAWGVIQTVFNAFKTAISAVGSVFGYVFDTVIMPMWNNFETAISAVWAVLSPVFELLKSGWDAIGQVFQTVWTSVISPMWEGIKAAFQSGWNFLSGLFEQMKAGFQVVATFIGGVWSGVATAIKTAFDGILNAIKVPLRALGGILVAVPTNLGPIQIPGGQAARDLGAKLQALATGGTVQGPGGTDNVLAWLTAGEGVVTKSAMNNGGAPLVAALNNGWVPPVDMIRSMVGTIPGFAEGLNPGADYLRSMIMRMWPQITTIGGRRSEDGYGEHSSGNAIDVMIPGWDTPAGKALGDSVASFVVQNKDALGLDGMIWRQTSFGYGGSFTSGSPMSDRGSPTQNHMDHVHIILGKGRGAGAPAVNAPTTQLVGGSGASAPAAGVGALWPGGSSAASSPGGSTGATSLPGGAIAASGQTGSADNPYTAILQAIKQLLPDIAGLAQIGMTGLKETFLPPGFSDPQQWGLLRAGSGIIQWLGGLIGGFPGMQAVGALVGGAGSAIGGDASGAAQSFMSVLPAPFGNGGQLVGQNAANQGGVAPGLPGGPLVPDPAGAREAGAVNVDNSVHVAEGGQINENATAVLERVGRNQQALQTPQLGTRRWI